jgi:hypothetical protein
MGTNSSIRTSGINGLVFKPAPNTHNDKMSKRLRAIDWHRIGTVYILSGEYGESEIKKERKAHVHCCYYANPSTASGLPQGPQGPVVSRVTAVVPRLKERNRLLAISLSALQHHSKDFYER